MKSRLNINTALHVVIWQSSRVIRPLSHLLLIKWEVAVLSGLHLDLCGYEACNLIGWQRWGHGRVAAAAAHTTVEGWAPWPWRGVLLLCSPGSPGLLGCVSGVEV